MTKVANYILTVIAMTFLLFLLKASFSEGIIVYGGEFSSRRITVYCLLFVFVMIGFAGAVSLLLKKSKFNLDVFEKIFLSISCIGIFLVALYWNSIVPYHAEPDQLIVWQAAEHAINGVFEMFQHGGYINIYPQQKGLMLIYELLFRCFGNTDFVLISNMNAFTAPMALCFGYLIVKEVFQKRSVGYIFVVLYLMFFPYLIYTLYNYGDMPVVGFVLLLIWSIFMYRKTDKGCYILLASIAASFAVIFRSHAWIVVVALIIGLFFESIKNRRLDYMMGISIVILSVLIVVQGIAWQYAVRSEYDIEPGMPSVLWVAMGLQYSEAGAGQYNNYSKEVYYDAEGDSTVCSQVAIENIEQQLRVFSLDANQTWTFFREKIVSQWNDPLFESIKFTGTFRDAVPSEFIQSVYTGAYYTILLKYAYHYQFMIYFLAIIGVISALRKTDNILHKTPLIVFVGGFLFSMIWEAKARYMLMFFIMLIPYAAIGLDVSYLLMIRVLNRCKSKKKVK